jgi:hypothetical protein
LGSIATHNPGTDRFVDCTAPGQGFRAAAVEHCIIVVAIADQFAFLQRCCGLADAEAVYAQNVGEKFVRA